MLCDNCKKNVATITFRQFSGGKAVEYNLCKECETKLNIQQKFFDTNFAKFFQGFGGMAVQPRVEKCSFCGKTSTDIINSGFAGCENCYLQFRTILLPYIQRIQGRVEHTGKIPNAEEQYEQL